MSMRGRKLALFQGGRIITYRTEEICIGNTGTVKTVSSRSRTELRRSCRYQLGKLALAQSVDYEKFSGQSEKGLPVRVEACNNRAFTKL